MVDVSSNPEQQPVQWINFPHTFHDDRGRKVIQNDVQLVEAPELPADFCMYHGVYDGPVMTSQGEIGMKVQFPIAGAVNLTQAFDGWEDARVAYTKKAVADFEEQVRKQQSGIVVPGSGPRPGPGMNRRARRSAARGNR